ncbi:hypothetical protein [Estrella lausannensis]|uniref:N-acetyltransferase domain-containing protein n=1 Tax=Estrella lausannensis TaxID=483423 RepID=A0A0H5E5V9_9BACT|nr:hypothetical protein [Estrella lausannensis]CRX38610.1 hypothetical protein ELAC_1270 [Estrella lausannensis]
MQVDPARAVFLYPVTFASNRNFCAKILEEWEQKAVALLDSREQVDNRQELKGVVSLIGIAKRAVIKEEAGDSHLILVNESRVVALLAADSAAGVFKIHSLVFSPGYLFVEKVPLLRQVIPLIEMFALGRGCHKMQVQMPASSVPMFQEVGFSNPEVIKEAMDLTRLKRELPEGESLKTCDSARKECFYYHEFSDVDRGL